MECFKESRMILKKIAHTCRTRIHNGKMAKKAFFYSQCLLKRGLYYNPCDSYQLRRIDSSFFTLRNIIFSHLFYNHIQGDGIGNMETKDLAQDKLCFSSGMGKIVLLSNQYAYGFYNKEELYQRAKIHFNNYYNNFNYPCAQIVGFHDDKRLIIMERIEGKMFRDYIHDEIIAENLLYYNLECIVKEDEDKEILFLQHGDAKFDNIIWDKESCTFRFIDLDGIQFLPPLFDFLYYLNSRGYNLLDIENIIEKKKDMIKQICIRANITDNYNSFDILLYRYVLQFKKWGGYFDNFRFLTHNSLSDYPMTNKLLKDMQLGSFPNNIQ